MKKNRRKQNLSSRIEEEPTMSYVSDPFLNSGPDKETYLNEEALIIPSEWGLDHQSMLTADRSICSSLDMCPTSDLYADELIDVNAILNLDFNDTSPLFLEEPAQENHDIFQDVRYTSTPKSRPIECVTDSHQNEPSRKRPLFHVLHDITDSINCTNNESFININHVLDTTPPCQSSSQINGSQKNTPPILCTPPPSGIKKMEKFSPFQITNDNKSRKVSIIRKRITLRSPNAFSSVLFSPKSEKSAIIESHPPLTSVQTTSSSPDITSKSSSKSLSRQESSKEELIYYTGINSYDVCLALLKHIKLPQSQQLSRFKMQLITLMKLRLDLQWRDIAFRFECDEDTVRSAFLKTLTVFAECLTELLPWHGSKKCPRKASKTYFTHIVRRHSYQVLLIISDGRKPINYVTSMYCNTSDPLSIVISECNENFVKGDIINVEDAFYRFQETGGTLFPYLMNNTTRLPNIKQNREVVDKMMELYPLLSIEADADLHKILIIVGALTNLNYMPAITMGTLKMIYQKSAEAVFTKYST